MSTAASTLGRAAAVAMRCGSEPTRPSARLRSRATSMRRSHILSGGPVRPEQRPSIRAPRGCSITWTLRRASRRPHPASASRRSAPRRGAVRPSRDGRWRGSTSRRSSASGRCGGRGPWIGSRAGVCKSSLSFTLSSRMLLIVAVRSSHFADPPPQQQHGGQEYEMVDVQVVEETPERTVSISTWREQVIHETEIDDGMSVCYVNAEGAYVRVREEGTRPMVDRSPSIPSSKVLQGGRRTESISEFGRQPLRHHPSTSSKPSSDPRTSTPKGSGTLIQPLDSPLFHALKHTGSIISSIPPKSAEELDDFLCSCQPSLLHISSVLHKVGIRTMDHLRAVGRLSAETRNREVREQVLRRGVTVVEWAILLDRLRGV
ncbi:unnamed protein product [Mycena citricolor]|uniref:Uncharacterized protein n=1 Tax=Mycena citricolor TaxID=2018698 RepID=A0AAD2Q775_9AGAR|nr:unnamed protein product [Mycena citricolor]